MVNVCIGIPKDFQTILFQNVCTFRVVGHSFWRVVLSTIQFNHNFCFVTIKIYNEPTNRFLPLKAYGIMAQKVKP